VEGLAYITCRDTPPLPFYPPLGFCWGAKILEASWRSWQDFDFPDRHNRPDRPDRPGRPLTGS
jgi:hypothetical protein